MTSLYMYYALSLVLVEQSVCHEPIFVLINVYILYLHIYIYVYIYIHTYIYIYMYICICTYIENYERAGKLTKMHCFKETSSGLICLINELLKSN